MSRIIDPYIFATEHVSVELLNNLEWKYVNEEHVSELRVVMVKYDITTVERLRHFLAQCDVESGSSEDFVEGEHGTGRVYAGYCGGGRIQLTGKYWYYGFAMYKALERYPELKEWVTYYNPAHFDFDIYISPQYINLLKAARMKGIDISEFTRIAEENTGPEYVAENYAWESAGYYWYMNGFNETVDSFGNTDPNNVDEITKVVNSQAQESHFEQKREAYEKIIEYVK